MDVLEQGERVEPEKAAKFQTERRRADRSHRKATVLDWFYELGVIFKGIDGLAELTAGTILLFAPNLLHTILRAIVGLAAKDPTPVRIAVAHFTSGLDRDLVHLGPAIVIFFLLSHGVVKLVLVYCLLRKFHRAYPWAIVVLSGFLIYQVYVVVASPSLGMVLFAILDAAIIVLVYKEYRELRRRVV